MAPPIYASVTVTAVSKTSGTASPWIPLNPSANPFAVGFGVVATPDQGEITYKVQHTFDNVFDPTITPVAFDHSTVSGKTTSVDGNYAYPVSAIRLVVMSGSGTAPYATLSVRQAGF